MIRMYKAASHMHAECICHVACIGLNFLEMVSGTIITTPTCHALIDDHTPDHTHSYIVHDELHFKKQHACVHVLNTLIM